MCGRNLSHGLFRFSNKDREAVQVCYWNCSLRALQGIFWSEVNTRVVVFSHGNIHLSHVLTWPVVHLVRSEQKCLLQRFFLLLLT